MKLHGRLKQTLALILAASSVISATPVFAIDYAGHWAEQAINEWREKGILNGYEDGSFKPKESITRAEFGKILVQLLGLLVTEGAETFQDIKGDEWYAEYVKLVSAAGYMKGTEGNFRPNAYITREEAAYAIATAYHMTGETDKVFIDQEDVSDWAESSIKALVAAGCIAGYPDGTVKPQGNLTRAEAVSMLDKITAEIINTSGTYSQDVKGNLVVNKDDVILQDMTIYGNLYLAEGIGEGDVELKNVKVLGATIVEGGGTNSVKVIKSELNQIIIHKQIKPVRIVTDEASKVPEVLVVSPAVLEGKLEEVKILTPEEVKIKAAEVSEVHILEEKAKIVLHEKAVVEKLVANASSQIVVEGTLKEAVVNADEVVFYNKPGKIEVVPGVEHPTIIEPSKPESSKPSTPSTPSDDEEHGGSVAPVPVPVTVTEVQVVTPPNKTTYIEGETLDLAGLEIKLVKSNGTTEVVGVEDFSTKGLTTTPAQETELTLEHTVIEITHTASGKKVMQNIIVTKADKESPVFEYDEEKVSEVEVEVEVGQEFTIKELQEKVKVTDNVDDKVDVQWQIKDAQGNEEQDINTDKVGSYKITCTAKDKAGNEATLIIKVYIKPKPIEIQNINIENETIITLTTPTDLTGFVIKWNDKEVEKATTQDTLGTKVTCKVSNMQSKNTLEILQEGFSVYKAEDIVPTFEWAEKADKSWYDEYKTDFEIYTASQLAGLAQIVNSGEDSFLGKTVTLMSNIDLLGLEWEPIGKSNASNTSFKGTFDGGEYTISNLSITKNKRYRMGLFGVAYGEDGKNGNIQNVTLNDIKIEGKDCEYVGALVGEAFRVNVTDCKVNKADITARKFVGGVIGYCYGNVTNCDVSNLTIEAEFDAILSVQSSNIGGIIGFLGESNYIVEKCTAQNIKLKLGHRGGGIIGACPGQVQIIDCALKGENTIESWYDSIGGIIGTVPRGATIKDCSVETKGLNMKIEAVEYKNFKGVYVGGAMVANGGSEELKDGDINFEGTCNFEGNKFTESISDEQFYIREEELDIKEESKQLEENPIKEESETIIEEFSL